MPRFKMGILRGEASISVNKMHVAGLFSGIGGFELAFSQAGFANSLLVEIDPVARAVLEARFPGCLLLPDVAQVDEIPSQTTVLTAGFPCQNLSMAGDKTGIGGAKSGIVEKMFELIDRSNVPTVLIENVYFMLQLDRGNGMRRLVEKFESLGYKWAYRVIDTIGFGLPQRRRRVYMLASRTIDPRTVLFSDETKALSPIEATLKSPLGFYWTEGRSGVGITVDAIPPLKVGSALGIPSAPAVLFPDGEVLTPSISACECLQGFPSGWISTNAPKPEKGPEWRLIGNAVSVPVVRWIAERLKTPGKILEFPTSNMAEGQRWPNAGWNVGAGRTSVRASDRPISVDMPTIATYRDASWSRLSDRALNGFISRAEQGRLRMPAGFLEALRNADRKISKAA